MSKRYWAVMDERAWFDIGSATELEVSGRKPDDVMMREWARSWPDGVVVLYRAGSEPTIVGGTRDPFGDGA